MNNKHKYVATETDPIVEKTALLDSITLSFEYNTLDYKWVVRDYLYRHNINLPNDNISDPFYYMLISMARSSFDYFYKYHDVITSDSSLKAITQLCSKEALIYHVTENDEEVFHLSRVFNQIVESTRRLHKCYDCGTNARAIFIKLIETHRGKSYISFDEQVRMKEEYIPRIDTALELIEKCYRTIKNATADSVYIMSMGIQDFGHVFIIEKRFIKDVHLPNTVAATARYHHYQSCFKSHLVIDFIEKKDYGRDLQQSLDIEKFFGDYSRLMSKTTIWNDDDTRLFCDLFAFKPVYPVIKPNTSFTFTYIIY